MKVESINQLIIAAISHRFNGINKDASSSQFGINLYARGSFGDVYTVKAENKTFVVKILESNSQKEAYICYKLSLLDGFNSEYISSFTFSQNQKCYQAIVFKKVLKSGEDYFREIMNDFLALDAFIKQIIQQLRIMHQQYVHKDIKLLNILVDDSNGEIKVFLIDFGLTQPFKHKNSEFGGTMGTISKSVLQCNKPGSLDDIIALILNMCQSISEEDHQIEEEITSLEQNLKLYEKESTFKGYKELQTVALYLILTEFLDKVPITHHQSRSALYYRICYSLISRALMTRTEKQLQIFRSLVAAYFQLCTLDQLQQLILSD